MKEPEGIQERLQENYVMQSLRIICERIPEAIPKESQNVFLEEYA